MGWSPRHLAVALCTHGRAAMGSGRRSRRTGTVQPRHRRTRRSRTSHGARRRTRVARLVHPGVVAASDRSTWRGGPVRRRGRCDDRAHARCVVASRRGGSMRRVDRTCRGRARVRRLRARGHLVDAVRACPRRVRRRLRALASTIEAAVGVRRARDDVGRRCHCGASCTRRARGCRRYRFVTSQGEDGPHSGRRLQLGRGPRIGDRRRRSGARGLFRAWTRSVALGVGDASGRSRRGNTGASDRRRMRGRTRPSRGHPRWFSRWRTEWFDRGPVRSLSLLGSTCRWKRLSMSGGVTVTRGFLER